MKLKKVKGKSKAKGQRPKANGQIAKAIQVLQKGGIIIYPTETVYGLGADINNREAVERIFEIKGRAQTKALSIACLKEDIEKYAEVSDLARVLIENFLPGPLTLVLRKKKTVKEWITNSEYVGIRVPDNKTVQEILKKCGGAITSTSANISGEKDPISVKGIAKRIAQGAQLIIDEGVTKFKGPSTVLQVNGEIKMLRKGVLDVWTKERVY